MPRIESKLAENKPFFAGLVGEIVAAEVIKTAVSGYNGVRTKVKDISGQEYGEMLWIRQEVGQNSKLGCFMSVFGSETDLWLHKHVRILRWEEKERAIEEVPAETIRRLGKKKADKEPQEIGSEDVGTINMGEKAEESSV